MSNIKITVFTPTYNRAHLLKRVFESLQNQTDKNFIWQIVDDGSKDDTRNVVEDFKKSSSFEIQYLYKKNGGKHTAHNFGVENCKTDYFLILDSDDWLSEDAIEVVNKKIKKVDNLENISGIIGKKFCIDNSSSQAEMPKNIEFASGIELYEKYGLEGETLRIYKTSVLKEYLFPVIKNEKFVSENVVFDKIDQKYKMYVIPEKLYFYEYLDDGYSRNIDKIHLQSPIGYAISLKSSAETALFLKNKIKWTILYIIWCQKTNCINGYDKFNNKLLYILLLPIVKLFTIFKFPKFFFRAFNDKSLKRKNALIITLYGNFNFGNKLQNYALQEKIKDFGFNVQTLAIKYRYDSIFKNIKVVLGGLLKRIRLSKIDIKKEQEFLKFNKEHLFYKKGMCSTNPIIKRILKVLITMFMVVIKYGILLHLEIQSYY